MTANAPALTLLRRKEVEQRTGLSRASIYAKTKPNPRRPKDFDETFPKPVHLNGTRVVAWVEGEINEWIQQQIRLSRGAA